MKDRLFNIMVFMGACITIILLIAAFLTLLINFIPSLKAFGLKFFFGKEWDPIKLNFGALPFFIGTTLTSFLALIISVPISISISILLGEYLKEGFIASIFKNLVELLAGIPSVIYGFWGLFVLVPFVRKIEVFLNVPPVGVGIFTASIVLAVMIIPYSASIGREVIELVPTDIKEAAYSLGATKYEVIRFVILPYARSGIFAGILLSLGRAIGETMAVTMLIGNSNEIPSSIFSPGNTMASLIANEFAEATEILHLSSLVGIGFFLLIITTVISLVGRYIIKKISVTERRYA
ncbi:MAG: phosphate ABC transporter permease subunit PstC [Synergistetes bacterium]|nr:phosphate ABC transporter permease subunit PstC [Synergistota bacterium]MCX8128121.1 phosphate ABC transporter permease subunit PstC [Synergistota bacterium]MDW8192497.1 phosphate ABC transporter permease subunit PstC [Synergistota bacterium]